MRDRNHLLDGMRGVAAIIVVGFHLALFFGSNVISGGYLAVDFFFMLSGLVIARAYDARLAGSLGAGRFLAMRVVRLYPLFALGVLLGMGKSAMQIAAHQVEALSIGRFVAAIALNALMLPVPFPYPVMFPLNSPLWSLFCEMLINIAYALLLARLAARWLVPLILIGAGGMVAAVIAHPTIGLEQGGSLPTLLVGLARVTYGFCFGMAIARRVPSGARRSGAGALVLVAALILFLLAPVPVAAIGARDLLFAFVAVPLIVGFGARLEVPAGAVPLFARLGDLSYPLYALHYPVILGLCFVGARLHWPVAVTATAAMAAALIAAFVAERFIDAPVRRWLSLRLGLRESAPPVALAPTTGGIA